MVLGVVLNLPVHSHCHFERARHRSGWILAAWERVFNRTDQVQGRPR